MQLAHKMQATPQVSLKLRAENVESSHKISKMYEGYFIQEVWKKGERRDAAPSNKMVVAFEILYMAVFAGPACDFQHEFAFILRVDDTGVAGSTATQRQRFL